MRRLLLAVAAALVVVPAASAAVITGTVRGDLLHGTPLPDRILGKAGNDAIVAQDGGADRISCGPGVDIVSADASDHVAADCEIVDRKISLDPYTNSASQHEADVEPDSFAWGSTVVATYQIGRIESGAAANIGFATSHDAGRTWRSGALPSLTAASSPRGAFAVASDPSVAYDSVHNVWMIVSLALAPDRAAIVVSRSTDGGATWSAPVTVREVLSSREVFLDKEWIACDNRELSPFRGHCYVSYSDFAVNRMSTQFSADGGVTWSQPAGSPDDAGRSGMDGNAAPGPQPLVTLRGTLVIPIFENDGIYAVQSTDGGVTFSPETKLAPTGWAPGPFRSAPLPSGESDAQGGLYVAWSDGAHIQLLRSADGVSWRGAEIVPFGSGSYYVPSVAASQTRPGELAVTAYRLRPGPALDFLLVRSHDGGQTWTAPQRLNPEPVALSWLAETEGGRMLGDYVSTSFAGGRLVPVFTLAARPTGARLHEAIFAASLR